jgi:hypothetical protein
MTDLLFGSLPQLWPTMPIQPYGYFQTPTPAIGGPFNGVPPAIVTSPEIPNGVSAQALLSAVAIRRGQPMGPTNDGEVEDFISDALDVTPGATDVEVRCENGRVILTGTVSHKRLKRDAGEIAWAIPSVSDVQNNVSIVASRRRARGREAQPTPASAGRKQSS